jgi:hypothetical protein
MPTCRTPEAGSPQHADIDPALARQLALAADDTLVEAVLLLRQNDTSARSLADPAVLLQRVCENDRSAMVEMNYLPRIGALIVRARSSIIRRLIEQPEVAFASANRVEDEARSDGASFRQR